MKTFFFILITLPFFGFSQTKNTATNASGFTISGNVTGYDDGTSVSFLNDQTGQPEKQTTIEKGKFIIKGKLDQPGFKVLVFGDQPPVVPIFLENSQIKVSGNKNEITELAITGSKTHTQYVNYLESIKPYTNRLAPDAVYDSVSVTAFEKACEDFVKNNPTSYVSPIALIQLMQASKNVAKTEKLYKTMSDGVKDSDFGQYLNQQIGEAKINPIGSVITEFSQDDTSGKSISISSFKGKYVLVDFWASWCKPCRAENPNIVAVYSKYSPKNFTVLGVSLDQAKPAWLNAIKMDGLTWTHLSDLKGWGNEVAALFHVTSIPQNFLIDPQGKIIAKNLRGEALNKKLEELLK